MIQYATARIGAILVNINPAYKAAELEYALDTGRREPARAGARLPRTRLRRDARRGPAGCPRCATRSCSRTTGTRSWPRATRVERRRARRARGRRCSSTTRSTSSTRRARPAARRARRSRTTTSSTTRTSSAGRCGYTEHDRVCVPVPFYHCFGMVLGNLACVTHGACMVVPGESFDAAAVLETVQAERCTSLYGVPTMFIAELADPRLRAVRPVAACAPASWPARRARSR